MQDLGLVHLLRENLPGLVLHASTQMGICDLDGARIAHDMGLSRVVLAREMSLDAVKRVCKDAGTEVEVFGTRRHVHERFRGVSFFIHGRGAKRKPRHMCAALSQTHGVREKAGGGGLCAEPFGSVYAFPRAGTCGCRGLLHKA